MIIARYIGGFLAYLGLQVFVFNNFILFDVALAHVFLCFLLMLPINLSFSAAISIGFAAGLLVDIFSYNSLMGLHAFSAVLMMTVRVTWVDVITNRVSFRGIESSMLSMQPLAWYPNYLIPLIFVHHLAYYFLEAFSFQNTLLTLSKVLFSAIFTFIWCMIFTVLFHRTAERR